MFTISAREQRTSSLKWSAPGVIPGSKLFPFQAGGRELLYTGETPDG